MAHSLHLNFVGNQARIFNGNLLGLPVVGLPYRAKSMINLKVTLVPPQKQKGLHFGTQVTSGLDSPLSIHTEQVDTLYSFNNEILNLKGKFSLDINDKPKADTNNSTKQSLNLHLAKKQSEHHNVPQLCLHSAERPNFTTSPKRRVASKVFNFFETLRKSPTQERITSKGRTSNNLNSGTQFKNHQSAEQLNNNLKSTNYHSLHVKTKSIQMFSYDNLPLVAVQQNVVNKPNQLTLQKPPRYSKVSRLKCEVSENFQLIKQTDQQHLSGTQPVHLLTAKENLATYVQPYELFTIKTQSKIKGLFYSIQTRDQYVKKHFEQGKVYKIKNREPQVVGLLHVLNSQFDKAVRLLTKENLCVCLIEQGKLDEALILAEQLNFTDALKHLESYPELQKTPLKSKSLSATPVVVSDDKNEVIKAEALFKSAMSGTPQSHRELNKDSANSSNLDTSRNKSQVFDLPIDTPYQYRIMQMSRSANNFQSIQYFKSQDRPLSSKVHLSGELSETTVILNTMHQESSNAGEKPVLQVLLTNTESQILQNPTSLSGFQDDQIKESQKFQDQHLATLSRNNQPLMQNSSQHLSIGNQSVYTSKQRMQSTNQFAKQVTDLNTEELLSALVQQRIAGIERFKLLIGGQEKMDKYIAAYADEWRSGKIRYQNTFKQVVRPWSSKKEESAYDLSKSKYKEYKGTINLLVEDLLNRDESKFSESNLNKTNIKLAKESDLYDTSAPGAQKDTPQSDFKLKFQASQTKSGFESAPSLGHVSQTYKQEQQNPSNQRLDGFDDIEIPDNVQKRYQNAIKTVKQGIVDPLVSELMSTQLSRQEIYDRSKAVRHLEKLLADDSLISANSEHLEENFWSKVEILHRNEQKQDLFYIDENMTENIIGRLRSIAQNDENAADAPSKELSQNSLPISNLLNLLKTQEDQQRKIGDLDLASWFQRLYKEISVSRSLHILLEQRFEYFQHASSETEHGDSEQQQNIAYSVLLTIREQFAIKSLKSSEVDYEMLARMLSSNNYFSHFNSATRKKLILISQHRLIRQGEVLLHSDQLNDTIVVIISGAVSVHMCNKAKKNLRSFRNTLYPGESIGDAPLRLIIPADKVDELFFELKAAVDSDILLIKKDDVPSILENEIRSLMLSKIIPLQRCSLFSGAELQSPYSIFVLANLVQTKTFQIGDIIQQQGKQVEDSMYLVVRGFCKAVLQTTLVQFHRKKNERQPQFKNSKEIYSEMGVIQQHLNSINPTFVVKNIRQSLRTKVLKMKPSYLPKVKQMPSKQEKNPSEMQQDQILNSTGQSGRENSVENSVQHEDSPVNEQMNTADSDESDITNRTQKLRDQEALVGHQRAKIIESTFEFIEPKLRLTQNRRIIETEIAVSSNKYVLRSKLASKDLKTAKVDLITHTKTIGEGETFCMRSLLDKQRCIKQLQNELSEFKNQLRLAEEARQNEFLKKSGKPGLARQQLPTQKDNRREQLDNQMNQNDENLPEGIRPKLASADEEKVKTEQKGIQLDSDAFRTIFKQLRALLGDEQLKNNTAQQLFDHLNSSQLTIVADSSDVLVLCIRRQDLSQLSEPVRRRVERDILAQLFIDLDRPFVDRKDFANFINQHKQWQQQKLTQADSIIFNQ